MSLAELREILAGPCSRHPVKRLTLFGSVARGDAGEGSDLDLLVQFKELPPSEYASHYFDLLHEIQDAVGSKVDLLTPSGVTRPSLQRNIRDQGVMVYEA